MKYSVLVLAAFAWGCGSDEAGPNKTPEVAIEPWGLPAAGGTASSGEACDTVIVIALDKVLGNQISHATTPHLNAVRAGAMVVQDAVTTSTAGNAALASLLTGRHVMEHGIISLRDAGCQTLPASEFTLAEGFAEAGWATIFSSGSPLHARGFSGFSQGFRHYEAPRLGERTRPADSVVNGALLPLKRALDGNESVFACLSFDDLTARSLRAPDAEITAPFVRARLAPLIQERADIEAALLVLDGDPEKGLDDLGKLLARARGSRASIAWNMALRDAHMAMIDEACAEILGALEAAGRQERALVVVTGLRGTLPPGYSHGVGALFKADTIRVGMAIRWPGGARRDEPVTETASLLDLPRALASVGGFELGSTAYASLDLGGSAATSNHGRALVVDSQRKLYAAVEGDLHIEQYSDGASLTFDRSGQQARGIDPARLAALTGDLGAFVEAASAVDVSMAFEPGGGLDALQLDWTVGGGAGRVLGPGGSKRDAVRGALSLGTSDDRTRSAGLRLVERAAAVRMHVAAAEGTAIDPSLILLGSQSVRDLPLLMAPAEDVAAVEADTAPARLRFVRSDGLWWSLNVDPAAGAEAGEEIEVLLSIWPPRDLVKNLEVSAGGNVRRHDVPGRADMVRITGPAPLVCRVKKLGKEDFTVACRTPDGFLAPTDMEFNDIRYADPHGFSFVVPRWQGAASPALPALDAALYTSSGNSPGTSPSLTIRRSSLGPMPSAFMAPDVSDLAELVRLVPGE